MQTAILRPVARREGLLVRELGEETIIFDRKSSRAHCLNRSAAFVWHHSDGTRTVAEIATLLGDVAGPGDHKGLVLLALETLTEACLLDGSCAISGAGSPNTSRRELLRRAGMVLALPVVASIAAPTPAQAQSDCPLLDYGSMGSGSSCSPLGAPCACANDPAGPCTGTCAAADFCNSSGAGHCHPCADIYANGGNFNCG